MEIRARPKHAIDYQDIARPLAVMRRDYKKSASSGWHSHRRGELLYSNSGYMTAQTEDGAFMLPSGYAVLLPPDVPHTVDIYGEVEMHAVFIEESVLREHWEPTRVLKVSPLLDASVQALAEEPVLYDENGRGQHLTALILDEVRSAQEQPYVVSLPTDKQLRKLCRSLLDNPGLDLTIDDWADEVGMSRRTMTRKFRLQTGMSFVEWRQRLRVSHVMRKRAEGMPLAIASVEAGYQSVSTLKKTMKRLGGQ
ncbi:AraC-like DNA-binding protein/mannose-6-phosphate isomerase-like protein (cupin superfamily) [Ochrobactrum sp. 19YEA23]|uniref:AraC family transcriptional regulator n=1 Tax=Ochrobactrum sp. 19YEA23 TaxID=3039854 RepID=UPI002478B1BA|nr:AraC-like DNA-binding protein/mannose-6-phosphate isomerase-like protein (cupin superfamily) [Ochrobactrum sp. 19YEA23]